MKGFSKFLRAALSPALLVAYLSGSTGCGIDVGNAGKPLEGYDGSGWSELIGLQYGEALEAALEGAEQEDEDTALRLLAPDAQPSSVDSCMADASDGSILVTRDREKTDTQESGKAQRKTIKDVLSVHVSIKLRSSGAALACNGDKALLPWLQLTELTSHSQYTRQRSRRVSAKADDSLLKESRVSASGERMREVKRLKANLQEIVIQKTTRFQSRLERAKSGDGEALTSQQQTLEGEPLVTLHQRDRKAGAKSLVIASGALAATDGQGRKVVMRFQDVHMASGSNCTISSGTLSGEIYGDGIHLDTTYGIIFGADAPFIRFADGSEVELEMEACSIP